jgi:hypothetical protein
MRKQIFFLLLFPLALSAQQTRMVSDPTGSASSFSKQDTFEDDNQLAVATVPKDATEMHPLPDAPEPRATEAFPAAVYEPKGSKQPVAAVKAEPVFNKKFIAVHTGLLASIVYDAELTHQGLAHHKCVESNTELGTHPGRGTIYGQNMLAFGAISGLDWVAARFIKIPFLPYITPTVAAAEHITGGSKWLTECW